MADRRCSECGDTFVSEHGRKIHESRVHAGDRCDRCDRNRTATTTRNILGTREEWCDECWYAVLRRLNLIDRIEMPASQRRKKRVDPVDRRGVTPPHMVTP